MKRVVGITAIFLGILFLIRPDFDLFESLETLLYMIYTYWPMFLICLGVYLQANTPKKKRRS